MSKFAVNEVVIITSEFQDGEDGQLYHYQDCGALIVSEGYAVYNKQSGFNDLYDWRVMIFNIVPPISVQPTFTYLLVNEEDIAHACIKFVPS